MKPTLLILAAGMGSRYGGLKQLDKLGPNGETIMDYSVFDAIEAGFGKIVFVIRKSMETDFKATILAKYKGKIALDYVFQELDTLPGGFAVHPERVKPYGTAHAILVARHAVKEPFAVINADDFYGKEAFKNIAGFLQHHTEQALPVYGMIGYQLSKTLSENGSVSRGVCKTDDKNELVSITEMTNIRTDGKGISNIAEDGTVTPLEADSPVSMNFWGFMPDIFPLLEKMFINFLEKNNGNPKAEFQIPTVVNHFLISKTAKIQVLKSDATWFGVTFIEDRETVVARLADLVKKGIYPSPLLT